MSPRRRAFPPLIALLAAACAEESSTLVAPSGLDEPLDLEFTLPHIVADMFVRGEYVDSGAHRAQALVSEAELPPEEDYLTDTPPAETAIWNATTTVFFWPLRLEAVGEHDYIGNKSRVDVHATVRHDGAVIGSQPGFAEQAHFFLNPFPHHIYGIATIHLTTDCGLDADAKSDHSVWWEFAPGTGPSVFDKTGLSTYSTREFQPPCEPEPSTGGGSGGGGGGGLPEELTADYTCYMWFTYDEATLEVLDIQATWCIGGG